MEKRMSMRYFLQNIKNDIDVYNNVTDEAVCYCPPIKFTEEGEKHFRWTLDHVFLNVNEEDCYAIVICNENNCNWKLIKHGAFDLLYSIAGYCSSVNYDKWFIVE